MVVDVTMTASDGRKIWVGGETSGANGEFHAQVAASELATGLHAIVALGDQGGLASTALLVR